MKDEDDGTWIPEVGRLIARCVVGAHGVEITVAYRDRENDSAHFMQIALIRNFFAEPYHAGFIEYVSKKSEVNFEHQCIQKHYLTYEELCSIPRLWDSDIPINTWVEEVLDLETLAKVEKDRIKTAVERSAGGNK